MGEAYFIYNKLDSAQDQIRLLQLNRESDEAGLVSCELITTTLESAPPYYALSYTWGERNVFNSLIRCNSALLEITHNLNTALTHLRHLDENKYGVEITSRYFWVDQICVNQSDLQERGDQVQKMRRIYANTRNIRAVIWYGDDDSFVGEAFPFLDQIYDVSRREYPHAACRADIPTSSDIHNNLKNAGLPPLNKETVTENPWRACRDFITVRWTSRIWVIQECASSSMDPIIVIKRAVYPWNKLYWAATWLFQRAAPKGSESSAHRTKRHYDFLIRNASNIATIGDTKSFRRSTTLKSFLEDIIGRFDAGDPRDLIYALVGMSSDVQESTGPKPAALVPDYTKPCGQVFRDVVRYLMTQDQNISLLLLYPQVNRWVLERITQERAELLDQPSWTPLWELDYLTTQSDAASQLFSLRDIIKNCLLKTRATKTIRFPDVNTLQLNGTLISPIISDIAHITGLKVIAIGLLEIIYHLPHIAPEKLAAGLLSALYMRQPSENEIWDLCAFLFFETNIARMQFFDKLDQPSNDDLVGGLSRTHLTWIKDQAPKGDSAEFARRDIGTSNRRFFVTQSGYVGIGPSAQKQNDLLYALDSGQVLYVLRPRGSSFLYVGDCWVHDLMTGKVQQMYDAGELKDEVLNII